MHFFQINNSTQNFYKMGNQPLKAPKVEKVTNDGENDLIKYGMCEMQGWRNNMVLYFFESFYLFFIKIKGRRYYRRFGL